MGETRIILDKAYLDLAERRTPGLKAALLAFRVPDFTPPPGKVAFLYHEWRRLISPPSPREPCGRRTDVPADAPGAPRPAPPTFLAGRLRLCRSCPSRSVCAVWASGDCHGRAYLGRPLACCPLDPPRWGTAPLCRPAPRRRA